MCLRASPRANNGRVAGGPVMWAIAILNDGTAYRVAASPMLAHNVWLPRRRLSWIS